MSQHGQWAGVHKMLFFTNNAKNGEILLVTLLVKIEICGFISKNFANTLLVKLQKCVKIAFLPTILLVKTGLLVKLLVKFKFFPFY